MNQKAVIRESQQRTAIFDQLNQISQAAAVF